ncbi:MAG: tautomerase family protein [Bdellovibrionota bacterium]
MPILDVEIVGASDAEGLARRLADAAGIVLGSAAGGTWVKLRFLPRENYAENGDLPARVQPVFVSVLLGRCFEGEVQSRLALKLAEEFSKILDRPRENIHLLFEPSAAGRIAFGGKL